MDKLFGNLGLGTTCSAQLEFINPDGSTPKTISVKGKRGELETVPVFTNKDTISGNVKVTPVPGKRVEHHGIRVQLIGEIERAMDRGHPHEFVSLVRDLAPPGDLHSQQIFPFEFKNVEMEFESYRGVQIRLRYAVRVSVLRGLGQSIVKDYVFWVQNVQEAPLVAAPSAVGNSGGGDESISDRQQPIKMEVGIEDCLHIEFEYEKGSYHLSDTVIGKIYFLLVRIKLKHMELEIKRKETVGSGISARAENTTVAKYEIMDGAPVRGEVIPIRMHLAPYDVTPTYPNVSNKFSVKYSLNLVLVDEEDRRYFKQQEVVFYRQLPPAEKKDGRGGVPVLSPRAAERALSHSDAPVADVGRSGGGVASSGSTEGEELKNNTSPL